MGEPVRKLSSVEASQQQPDETHVSITKDGEHHETTTVNGHNVNFESTDEDTTRVSGQWSDESDEHVRELISSVTAEREKRESVRANHRNLNRMLTLLGALVIGLIVTWTLTHGVWGSYGPALAPYAFCITILLDSGLALYSYVKHY